MKLIVLIYHSSIKELSFSEATEISRLKEPTRECIEQIVN